MRNTKVSDYISKGLKIRYHCHCSTNSWDRLMKLCHFFSLVSISKIHFISTKKYFPRCVKSERYDYSFKYDKKLLPCLTWWCWIYKLEGLSNFNLLFFINVSTNISKVKEKSLKSWSVSQPSGYLSPEAKIIFRTTKLSVIILRMRVHPSRTKTYFSIDEEVTKSFVMFKFHNSFSPIFAR